MESKKKAPVKSRQLNGIKASQLYNLGDPYTEYLRVQGERIIEDRAKIDHPILGKKFLLFFGSKGGIKFTAGVYRDFTTPTSVTTSKIAKTGPQGDILLGWAISELY